MPKSAAQSASASTRKVATRQRTYVLDTSVLLSDPRAIFRFAEHEVVLPVVVVSELEKKRNDPEIGYFARQALRFLDDLRVKHERLDMPIAVGDGGSLRVELNHTSDAALPSGLRLGDNDTRILSVALNLSQEGLDVVVVSKDLPLRVKASSIGLAAEEYRDSTGSLALAELPFHEAWIGQKVSRLGTESGARIGYVNRFGDAILPHKDLVVQERDIVHAIFRLDEQAEVMRIFSNPPAEH